MASGVASEVVPSLWPEGQPHQIEKKELPFYFGALENPYPGAFPLYFADGVNDLPYVELRDFAGFMNAIYPLFGEDYQITVDVNEADGIVFYTEYGRKYHSQSVFSRTIMQKGF